MNVFLDTEFTDFIDTHLMSLGMVTASGEAFYAELPYPDQACSAFVREAVIPLLGQRSECIYNADELPGKILSWLSSLRKNDAILEICFDYQTDWDLFADALQYAVPGWCQPRLISHQLDEILLYEFYRRHGLPRHHALYDAKANCYAFRP